MSSNSSTLATYFPKDAVWSNPQSGQGRIDKIGSTDVLRFPNGLPAIEAYFDGIIPSGTGGYTATTGIKVIIAWCVSADKPSTTGAVEWGAAFQLDGATDTPIPYVDNFPAFGATNEVRAATTANTTVVGGINYTSISVPITKIQNGQTTAPAAGDHYRLRVRRCSDDATNDTLAATAYLYSVQLQDY